VANKNYKLIPNVYRDSITPSDEHEMRNYFKDKAKGFINYSGLEDFEWYFLMQHFGLKTRLLD
jgi:FRG domain.